MTTKSELSHSEQQAAAQMESIREMVAALECDYDRLAELRDERDGYEPTPETDVDPGTAATWAEEYPDDAEELAELEAAAGECESREDAETRIHEDPLSVEVRSGWYTPSGCDDSRSDTDPAEYCILLCTGGPACRIVGDLDRGEPTSARLQHQDWGTPWTEWFDVDREALLTYARQFLFAS